MNQLQSCRKAKTGNVMLLLCCGSCGSTTGCDRDKIYRSIQSSLNGNFSASQMSALVFKGVQKKLVSMLVGLVEESLPVLFDGVGDVGGVVAVPATTVGVDVGVATGSCATEWLSSGSMNVVEQIWGYAQTAVRGGLANAVKALIGGVLNLIFDGVYDFIIEPLATAVDSTFAPLMNKLSAMIPESVKQKILGLVAQVMPKVDIAALPATKESANFKKAIALSLSWMDPNSTVTCSADAFTCGATRISMSVWLMLPLLLMLCSWLA